MQTIVSAAGLYGIEGMPIAQGDFVTAAHGDECVAVEERCVTDFAGQRGVAAGSGPGEIAVRVRYPTDRVQSRELVNGDALSTQKTMGACCRCTSVPTLTLSADAVTSSVDDELQLQVLTEPVCPVRMRLWRFEGPLLWSLVEPSVEHVRNELPDDENDTALTGPLCTGVSHRFCECGP